MPPPAATSAALAGPTISSSASNHPFLQVLERCPDLATAQRAHARMLRLGLLCHPHPAGRLIAACCVHPSWRDPSYALRVFDHLAVPPDLFTWNVLIRAHASSGDPHLALFLFSRLLRETPHRPDKFTFPFALKAAAAMGASGSKEGRALHGMVVKSPFRSDVFVLNSLLHFYGAVGCLDDARQLFEKSCERDVVSWNTMITAATRAGYCDEALAMFREMGIEGSAGVAPNEVTVLAALSACGQKGELELGRWIHSFVGAAEQNLVLSNALLDMYVKCGSLDEAKQLFDRIAQKDAVSMTTMLVGLAKAGDLEAARQMFDETPDRDVACWNALISAYEQGGRPKESMELFRRALAAGLAPDQVTLVAALSACAQMGALHMGRWIHGYMKKNHHHLEQNSHLTTSLIDMYCKCGDLEQALEVFASAGEKNVFVWSAMIAGLGMYGRGKAAVALFLEMQESRVSPNAVTFINVLSACSHSGLVEEGERLLGEMLPAYGIEPQMEHYAAMVDILARAGRFEAAVDLVRGLPVPPGAPLWGALLGACATHGKTALGEEACGRLLELEPRNDGAYVLLSNLYAKSGRWEAVARVRRLMKERGLTKEPGRSSMEVGGVVHEFLAGDGSHPRRREIYAKLEEITAMLRASGHSPDTAGLVLQHIEEEDAKERALSLHSEKLAMAFGLISTSPPAPIRIMKNLRVCEDCHSAAKLISMAYRREIFLRDRHRFHHFRDGRCSCGDFW